MRTPATRGCRATGSPQANQIYWNLRILSRMSHVCGRPSLAKDKASKVFYRKIKPAFKDALPVGKAGADCKCRKCSKSESQQRMKTLRTRKERNQIRDGGKEAPRAKSCHHYCNHKTSKDVSCVHQCFHNTLDVLPNITHVTHEPSVITDRRLIGHHGLFNHEVKSIDIERLLSEQRKHDRCEKLQQKSNTEFANPSTKETGCLLDSTNEETVISNSKDLQTPRILNYSERQEKKTMESNNQVSDLTPGQRPRKTAISSTETNKSVNSSDVVFTGMKEAQPGMYANSDSHQTPGSFNENKSILPGSVESIIERTPQKHVSANPRQVSQPTPLLPSSPPMARASSSLITQQENLDADSVAKSVKAIAASLCNSICFSLLGKRDLVAESREALVKVLQEKHGTQLRSNVLKIQRKLYSCDDAQEEGSELCCSPIFANRKEGAFSSDEFPAQSKTTGFTTSSFEQTGRFVFDWHSNDWSSLLDETAEWLGTSPKNPAVPDGTFSHRTSSQFSVDFEFRNAMSRERDYLFSPPFGSSCVDEPKNSGRVDDFFASRQEQEFSVPQQEHQNYMAFSDITTVSHRRNPLDSIMNNYSVEPLHSETVPFPHMHSSFETQKYFDGKSFFNEIPYFDHKCSFEPFSHVNFPLDSPSFRPVDLAHYPPSYMLEKGPILPTSSSFPSPEHWSFPPMRLY
ncbi:uncharacterized protein si:dkey-250k15.4 isoform X2 [Boleophthalmus pectinirostris]|uniref:uncharacterized protein si:dkey-250k15.4 isoform X2 n=1 Tax=Boleophthalmus pectinirostris TaxID=150288 RepID=UPI00242E8986|nr:uncharacterized protein si:dkey-250k15.4 isoform X2 [Boleophthalmus pectinirostris]